MTRSAFSTIAGSRRPQGSTASRGGKLAALALATLGITATHQALAMSGYDASVADWCAAAARPAPAAAKLSCSSCHADKTRFQNLRSDPTNPAYLNYFCKAAPSPTNKAPVVRVKSTANAVEGKLLTLKVTATDPDSDPVTLAATHLPQGAGFDAATGIFSWTPEPGTAGTTPTVTVSFEATDAPTNGTTPLTGKASVTLQVSTSAASINSPPVINPIPEQNATVGTALSFKVKASDKDGDTVTVSAAGQPLDLGATFDPSTGTFTWTPTADQVTTPATPYTVTFTATDNAENPASVTEEVNIFVNAAGGTDATIKRIVVTKAQWKSGSGTLTVRGKLGRTKGKLPTDLSVNIIDGDSGANLGSATVNRKGVWVLSADLGQGGAPCSVQAEVNGLTAGKTVARSGCGGSGTGGNGGGTGGGDNHHGDDGDDDDSHHEGHEDGDHD